MRTLLYSEKEDEMEPETWIETITGKRIDPIHIQAEDICIEDIAKPLSQLCRFTGQCSRFYSVGQHSVHVADMVEGDMSREITDIERINHTCLAALLHDAAEAYTNDIVRPIKYSLRGLKEIDDYITGRIMLKFGCIGVEWDLIKKADNVMMATEAYSLMPSKGKGWYLPNDRVHYDLPELSFREVEDLFMSRFLKFGGIE